MKSQTLKTTIVKLVLVKWAVIFWIFKLFERYKNWWLKRLGAENMASHNRVRKPLIVINSEEREKAAEVKKRIDELNNLELAKKQWE